MLAEYFGTDCLSGLTRQCQGILGVGSLSIMHSCTRTLCVFHLSQRLLPVCWAEDGIGRKPSENVEELSNWAKK